MAYPMTGKINAAAFCQFIPLLGEAVRQAHQNYQSPSRLCLLGGLAAISSAIQPLADVVMPYGATVPLSLFLLGIAKSGERKSAVEHRFMQQIRAIEETLEADHKNRMADYNVRLHQWKGHRKRLEKILAKEELEYSERKRVSEELVEHWKEEPEKPQRGRIIYEDISPIAMLAALNEAKVGALVSSEGGIVVDGKSFDGVPYFNSLWSGESVRVSRMGKPTLQINDARLMISVMLQPDIFGPHTGKKGDKVRGSGHWARYLVFNPESTQGTRFSKKQANSWEHMERFDHRISQILDRARMARVVGNPEREKILFSPEAASLWFDLADEIEDGIRSGGKYENASDHASKLAENMARVAALLHYFEGFEGQISANTLRVAADICNECSQDFIGLFVPVPEEISDAEELRSMMRRMCNDGYRIVKKNYLRQRCPNSLRSGGRFYKALDVLAREGAIRPMQDTRNIVYIDMAPGLALPWDFPLWYC
ncbi:YfjI family protein [Alloalcanivorax venustensis]|uniref:YfjI family protein n=1 Tax=Alloalcanivorax venustensis TaxID=172371 RepID=UPI0039C09C2A